MTRAQRTTKSFNEHSAHQQQQLLPCAGWDGAPSTSLIAGLSDSACSPVTLIPSSVQAKHSLFQQEGGCERKTCDAWRGEPALQRGWTRWVLEVLPDLPFCVWHCSSSVVFVQSFYPDCKYTTAHTEVNAFRPQLNIQETTASLPRCTAARSPSTAALWSSCSPSSLPLKRTLCSILHELREARIFALAKTTYMETLSRLWCFTYPEMTSQSVLWKPFG